MPSCKPCEADNREQMEEMALEAVQGRLSWREVARQLGLSHHQGLKNHMERHYAGISDPSQQLNELIEKNIKELEDQLVLATPEIKPFFFMIIHNLRGLANTKPSQQNLNAALKAIHEVVGMKTQNRLMMDFAMAAFKKRESELPNAPVLELVAARSAFDDEITATGEIEEE